MRGDRDDGIEQQHGRRAGDPAGQHVVQRGPQAPGDLGHRRVGPARAADGGRGHPPPLGPGVCRSSPSSTATSGSRKCIAHVTWTMVSSARGPPGGQEVAEAEGALDHGGPVEALEPGHAGLERGEGQAEAAHVAMTVSSSADVARS